MREGTTTVTAWLLATLALAAPGGAAVAQAAPPSSYQLPPASPTPDPRLQGPVVEDHPVAAPTTDAPPAAAPLARPSPAPTPSERPTSAAPRATASAAATPAATAPVASTPVQAAPQPSPSSSATPAPELTPLPLPSSAATAVPATPPAPTAPADPANRWPWYIAALALAGGIALAMWQRARRAHNRAAEAPQLPLRTTPSPPAGPIPARPRQAPIPSAPTLDLSLEARRFSATLVNASLDYRLRVTNAGAQPLADIAIGADMIGAHASLPAEAQLAQEGATFEPLHRIAALAPGESTELSGTLRLPLAGAAAIRQGTAALFVPLVRLCARVGTDGPSLASTHVIGEVPTHPGSGLRPFRLDLGPRIYPEIEQRKLAVPA